MNLTHNNKMLSLAVNRHSPENSLKTFVKVKISVISPEFKKQIIRTLDKKMKVEHLNVYKEVYYENKYSD